MKGITLATAAFLAMALAGCVNERESSEDDVSAQRERGYAISVADLATVRVDVHAHANGTARLNVALQGEDGAELAASPVEPRSGAANATLETSVGAARTMYILVTHLDGTPADVSVHATGVGADGAAVVLREATLRLG